MTFTLMTFAKNALLDDLNAYSEAVKTFSEPMLAALFQEGYNVDQIVHHVDFIVCDIFGCANAGRSIKRTLSRRSPTRKHRWREGTLAQQA